MLMIAITADSDQVIHGQRDNPASSILTGNPKKCRYPFPALIWWRTRNHFLSTLLLCHFFQLVNSKYFTTAQFEFVWCFYNTFWNLFKPTRLKPD